MDKGGEGRAATRGWVLVTVAIGVVGAGAQASWPSQTKALPCSPADVRWDSEGVARCHPGAPEGPVPAGPAMTVGRKLDLNRATAAELELLPGFGPSLAREVLRVRERSGGFRSLEKVGAVRGVGPAKQAVLRSAAEIR